MTDIHPRQQLQTFSGSKDIKSNQISNQKLQILPILKILNINLLFLLTIILIIIKSKRYIAIYPNFVQGSFYIRSIYWFKH